MELLSRLDWLIAWRHLRSGDDLPAWVRPLILGSVYLIAVGLALAVYAASIGTPIDLVDPALDPTMPVDLEELALDGADELGPTPLQRWYGTFGGITLIAGVMALAFGLLARFFNLLPTIIAMSVLLGCMALVVVLSLMSGLEGDLRDKILAQKAHIRVARSDGLPFDDYRSLAAEIAKAPGVTGASPYLEGEIMVRSRLNRQGAILSGIDPQLHATASNLPELVREGEYRYLTEPGEIPDPDPFAIEPETPWRLRHLEQNRKKTATEAKDAAPSPLLPAPPAGLQDTTPAARRPMQGPAGVDVPPPPSRVSPGLPFGTNGLGVQLEPVRREGHDEAPQPRLLAA